MVARSGPGIDFVAAEPLVDIADKARFAVFAVIDHVDAELDLLVHDLADGRGEPRRRRCRIERLGPVALDQRQEIGRPRQAAGVGGKNAIGTVFHDYSKVAYSKVAYSKVAYSKVTWADVMTFFQRSTSS